MPVNRLSARRSPEDAISTIVYSTISPTGRVFNTGDQSALAGFFGLNRYRSRCSSVSTPEREALFSRI
ncbi:hypothetical protein J6590_095928 [Homalodisca vitripennis]|nr:hypothetical protein J6590_095928 [Homalodisca vitripennis]